MINFDSVSFSSVSAEQCESTSIGQRICFFSGGQTILRNHLSTIALSSKYWQSSLFLLRTHENRKIVITSQLHKGYFINHFQVGDSRSTKWLSSTHKIDWCLRYFEEIKVKKVLLRKNKVVISFLTESNTASEFESSYIHVLLVCNRQLSVLFEFTDPYSNDINGGWLL